MEQIQQTPRGQQQVEPAVASGDKIFNGLLPEEREEENLPDMGTDQQRQDHQGRELEGEKMVRDPERKLHERKHFQKRDLNEQEEY